MLLQANFINVPTLTFISHANSGDSSDEDAEGRPGVFKGVDNLPKYHKQRKYPKQKGSYKDVKFVYKWGGGFDSLHREEITGVRRDKI